MKVKEFTDFLIRRTPHYDMEILEDVTPVSGWIGQVPTGDWGPFQGTTRIGHRIRRMFPDLSGCWKTVVESGCLNAPCDPTRSKVGFGFDQFQYGLEETYFETDLFCFNLVMSADAAKQQYAALIKGLREATIWIWNHRYRTQAVQQCKTKVLCGTAIANANPLFNDDCTTLEVSAAPTSQLTIQFLQRWVDYLILQGYLGVQSLPVRGTFFELITDIQTGNRLREGNPALQDFVTALSVAEFADLYKYGITSSIGNFMMHYDATPLRYQQVDATHYNMVLPYENQPAAAGIGADANWPYINASWQWDFIWHRSVMRSLVRRTAPINAQMPFSSIDFGGRWQAVMDNMTYTDPDTGTIVPINNEMRNKLKFIANFSDAIKPEHTEWGVAIFAMRSLSCVEDDVPCNDVYPYVTQDYSSANDPCPTGTIFFDIPAVGDGAPGPFIIQSAYCNDVALVGTPVEAGATVEALVTYLNANLGAYGTWSLANATQLQLVGSTCATIDVVLSIGYV